MQVAFAGTPEFAATTLCGLISSDHEVGLVISQPDARRGRGRKLAASPVAEKARTADIPLLQPEHISEVASAIGDYDALVVAAYGQILRPDTLYAATHGAWNVHASLLPAYRGAAPIERAIMNGEEETGVSIMLMDEGLDTGPFALKKRTPIPPEMNAGELTEKLAYLGSEAIVEVLSALESETVVLEEQDHRSATYASKLTADDRTVRWDLPARKIHDQVRALAPGIGARTLHPRFNSPIKILRTRIAVDGSEELDAGKAGDILAEKESIMVQCGEGVLRVEMLQAPGGRPVESVEFLRGNELAGAFINL